MFKEAKCQSSSYGGRYKVRKAIENIGVTMPEDLTAAESIKDVESKR